MRKLELSILRYLSERLQFFKPKFNVSLIRYWPGDMLEHFRNLIFDNLSNILRKLVCNRYFQTYVKLFITSEP